MPVLNDFWDALHLFGGKGGLSRSAMDVDCLCQSDAWYNTVRLQVCIKDDSFRRNLVHSNFDEVLLEFVRISQIFVLRN